MNKMQIPSMQGTVFEKSSNLPYQSPQGDFSMYSHACMYEEALFLGKDSTEHKTKCIAGVRVNAGVPSRYVGIRPSVLQLQLVKSKTQFSFTETKAKTRVMFKEDHKLWLSPGHIKQGIL